jgi:hypothetical protein
MDYSSFIPALELRQILAIELNEKYNDQALAGRKIVGIWRLISNSSLIFYLGENPK